MTASLYEKNGNYHVMLSWYDGRKRKQKSVMTGISVNGNNKRKAEAARKHILHEWEGAETDDTKGVLFSDYMIEWIEIIRQSVAETTYYEYRGQIERQICPYFANRSILLRDLKPHHIQSYYKWKMSEGGVSANTIHHYHANIHKALKHAYQTELIPDNPAAKVTLPKVVEFHGSYYSAEELLRLIKIAKGTKLEIPIMLASWFGMRRGEIVGCRWETIDLEAKTLYMNGVITDRGEQSQTDNLKYRGFGKTPSSTRMFPLTNEMVMFFEELWLAQWAERMLAGDSYNTKWLGFVCVDNIGNLIQPEYISYTFPKFLEKHGMRKIRFHDLRHTNATLLLEEEVPLKEIQVWLGHKSMLTTADTYAHVQTKAKQKLSETMSSLLSK